LSRLYAFLRQIPVVQDTAHDEDIAGGQRVSEKVFQSAARFSASCSSTGQGFSPTAANEEKLDGA
jgi:hypothetical protein